MALLPCFTCLGNLSIIEVYESYDDPCLFSCQNLASQIFLAVLIDESSDAKIWLYVALSKYRFSYIRSGGIDLYDCFKLAEDKFVYRVEVPFEDSLESQVEILRCERLHERILPLPGEFLGLVTETLPILPNEQLHQIASSSQREALRLKIELPNYQRNEAPIKLFGGLLFSFQSIIETIGYQIGKSSVTESRKREAVAQKTEVLATSTSGGSYCIDLISSEPVNLLKTSLVSDSLEVLFELLRKSKDNDSDASINEFNELREYNELIDLVSSLGKNVVSKYRHFLGYVVNTEGDFSLDWGSPNSDRGGSVKLTHFDATRSLREISQITTAETETITVVGILVGGNTKSRKFDIRDLEDQEIKYVGFMDQSVIENEQELVLNEVYEAEIEESVREDIATGKKSPSFKLTRLKRIPKN